jgi:hypothetical protein
MQLDTIAVITALVGIFGSLITGIVTLIQARSSAKSEDRRIDMEETRIGMDKETTASAAVTQIVDFNLRQSAFMQDILSRCQDEKTKLESDRRTLQDENSSLRVVLEKARILVARIVSDLQELLVDHEKLREPNCPNYQAIQDGVKKVLSDIESGAI